MTAFTWPVGWSQNTPTGVTNGGSQRTIDATCSGVTKRGVFSTKMKPSASAPASTAVRASSRVVMPQILTLTIESQLADLGGNVVRLHEALAHEDGARPGVDDPSHLLAG